MLNSKVLKTINNSENENKVLDRELQRMQKIDRLKVAQARNSFFLPDTGKVLPSLDVLTAANSIPT